MLKFLFGYVKIIKTRSKADGRSERMELALSSMISKIDKYAEDILKIPTVTLMKRSGEAVARAVRELTTIGGSVIILAGKGNNGGDGYAAACELMSEYRVKVIDVFSVGQRSEAGRYWRSFYESIGGNIKSEASVEELESELASCNTVVDAIFGTGFLGNPPECVLAISEILKRVSAKKIAVDVPLGVNADDGSLCDWAVTVDITVALSYIKPGLVSYPARANTGKVVCDSLGLDREKIKESFEFENLLLDEEWAKEAMPIRADNTNKGSFGRVLLITGSEKYRGAAHLSLEAALRGGVGLVTYLGEPMLCDELVIKLPEAIYESFSLRCPECTDKIIDLSSRHSATLVGSGSGCTQELAALVRALLKSGGGALVLDADALNSLAMFGGTELIKDAHRPVVLTPHPLEFSRMCGMDVSYIQAHRIECAKKYALENRCVLVLKGAATVVTDGRYVYINGSGSSALAKAGSGDVLAGLLVSLLAFIPNVLEGAALSTYIHGRAGDGLSKILSTYGVIPSDLPREIARVMSELER